MANGIVDALPLWALFLLACGVVLLSMEGGWRLGRRHRERSPDEHSAPIGSVVGAIMGLLAFLLAFTFGMAASRYDTRRGLVLEEANAIGTTYLRADLLPEPQRSEERKLLRDYTQLRVQAFAERSAAAQAALAGSQALQTSLWNTATAAATQNPGSYTAGLFVQALNDTIDTDARRTVADRNRVPDTIWLMLFSVTVLTMAAVGYQFGLSGTRSWPVTILLMLVFASVIVLIADLDRPVRGLVQVSQRPMLDLLDSMRSTPPQ